MTVRLPPSAPERQGEDDSALSGAAKPPVVCPIAYITTDRIDVGPVIGTAWNSIRLLGDKGMSGALVRAASAATALEIHGATAKWIS